MERKVRAPRAKRWGPALRYRPRKRRAYGARRGGYGRLPPLTRRRRLTVQRAMPYLSAIPSSIKLRMTTATTEGYSAATSGQKYLKLNSIFDPLGSHTDTNQPVGYDQWIAFYAKYMVISGIVEINFTSKSATTITERIACWKSAVTGGLTAWDDAACQPFAALYTMGGDKKSKIIRIPFKVSTILGEALDESNEGALVTADPTNLAYLNIWVTSTGGNYDCTTDIRIVQNVILFKPIQLDMSVQ